MNELKVSLGKDLGEGSFGTVYEGIVAGKPTYAVKVSRNLDGTRETLFTEDVILRYLHRDKDVSVSHVIKRFDICQETGSKKIWLVLELLGMNLSEYYRSEERGLSLKKTRQITEQLGKALSFLRKNKVIHGDIKPTNILMSADQTTVTLSDFGSATFSEPAYNPPDRCFQTICYRSPEVILEITATVAVDVWSLAALIAEIYCNKIIFNTTRDDEVELAACHRIRFESAYPAGLVRQGSYRGQRILDESSSKKVEISRPLFQVIQTASNEKKENSEQLKDLLDAMFIYDPKKRATPTQILQHPFLLEGKVEADLDEEESFDYW